MQKNVTLAVLFLIIGSWLWFTVYVCTYICTCMRDQLCRCYNGDTHGLFINIWYNGCLAWTYMSLVILTQHLLIHNI